jgi:hypothetical protein
MLPALKVGGIFHEIRRFVCRGCGHRRHRSAVVGPTGSAGLNRCGRRHAGHDPGAGRVALFCFRSGRLPDLFQASLQIDQVGDPYTVAATPQNDHIVTFTGLAPGTIEHHPRVRGWQVQNHATVTVIRPIHEVKIYTPKAGDPQSKGDGGKLSSSLTVVNNNSVSAEKKTEEADYRAILCNDVGCRPQPAGDK